MTWEGEHIKMRSITEALWTSRSPIGPHECDTKPITSETEQSSWPVEVAAGTLTHPCVQLGTTCHLINN